MGKLEKKSICLLDGTNILYSFLDFLGCSDRKKRNASPRKIYDRLDFEIVDFINKRVWIRGTEVYAVFDTSIYTFRQKIYPGYKAHKFNSTEYLPTEYLFLEELKYLKRIFKSVGVKIIDTPLGYESDDVIATLSKLAKKEFDFVHIFSNDNDLIRLRDRTTRVYRLYKNQKLSTRRKAFIGVQIFKYCDQHEQLTTEQLTQVKALTGDRNDNIPGIFDWETAYNMIKKFKSIEGALGNIDKVRDTDPIASIKLKNNIEQILINLKLVELKTDVNIKEPWKNN